LLLQEDAPQAASEPAVDDEEKAARERKATAQAEKEQGNAAYKKKDFAVAVAHYDRALELDDTDISFLTNRAAVFFEMGEYDKVQGPAVHHQPIGHIWSCSACRIGHLVSIWQPLIGSSFQ
jgi:tetratricopeptide (TPR) repeat protein